MVHDDLRARRPVDQLDAAPPGCASGPGTLETLAETQGRVVEPRTEEQPGRILHEIRSGLLDDADEGEETVYYGSVDATPLFVMLAGELHRWGGTAPEMARLMPHVRRALDWIEHYGDADGDGSSSTSGHRPRSGQPGLEGLLRRHHVCLGGAGQAPLALAEVQGYVYAALLAGGRLSRIAHDDDRARRLDERAAMLKRRFNEQFCCRTAATTPSPSTPTSGRSTRSLQHGPLSVDRHRRRGARAGGGSSAAVAGDVHRLRIRTLSASDGAYNPMSYHNGSVWPHDNAIIAAGLRRYGFAAEANRVILALLDARRASATASPSSTAASTGTSSPILPYPTSCSPQAWAAAAPLLLVRTLCGLEVDCRAGSWTRPHVPEQLLPLSVQQLHIAATWSA